MRTTAAVAYIQGGYFRETHAGDSRIYLFKNGCLYFQSRDHSVVQLLAEIGGRLNRRKFVSIRTGVNY